MTHKMFIPNSFSKYNNTFKNKSDKNKFLFMNIKQLYHLENFIIQFLILNKNFYYEWNINYLVCNNIFMIMPLPINRPLKKSRNGPRVS